MVALLRAFRVELLSLFLVLAAMGALDLLSMRFASLVEDARTAASVLVSIRKFGIGRGDRAAPGAMEFLQQFLGRSDSARHQIVERFKIAGLIAA